MIDFFKMGKADFWAASAMLSLEDFEVIWHPAYYAGLTDAYSAELDYWEYCKGFALAWEEHDAEIDSVEKPWLFEGFGRLAGSI
jgi:hypothetical protein